MTHLPDTKGFTLVEDEEVAVPENEFDVSTGIQIEFKDRIRFNASGQIWAGVALTGNNGPQGWNSIDNDPKFPLPGSHPFGLLGRIGEDYFYIGKGKRLTYTGEGGELFLRINDDAPGNGTGQFSVRVQVYRAEEQA